MRAGQRRIFGKKTWNLCRLGGHPPRSSGGQGSSAAAQGDLGNRWGVDKATVSKWVSEWERRQLISARQQFGRCKQLQQA